MRRMSSRVAVTSLVFAFVASLIVGHQLTGPVSAAHPGSASGGTDGTKIVAGVRFGTPPSSDGRDGEGCTWRIFYDYTNSDTPPPPTPPTIVDGDFTYQLWYRECPHGWEAHWIPDIDRETLGSVARSRAERLIPSLPLQTAPPIDRVVVGVGTWFWVPRWSWQKISVTAWVPTTAGVISATTEAEPAELIYTPGDGVFGSGPVRCDGPGMEWLIFYGDRKPSDCMYNYEHSSSLSRDGLFHALLTTVWHVSWSSNLGVGGDLPDIHTTSEAAVRVRELQALTR